MTPIEPGNVVLVPFPFTDQTTAKQRPAVVLSSHTYNTAHRDLILAPITGRFSGSDEVVLTDWQKAGLAKASAVKPLLASFEATLIRRKLGRLTQPDLAAVRSLFARILMNLGELRVQDVRFDGNNLIVDLADGRTLTVPLAWFPRLFHATPAERANWRQIGGGIGIHWPDLDEDIAVEDLILGRPSGESQDSLRRWLGQRPASS
jgi:mRNA-degrading endonuclease toxin of MazEF toxin-antitoxin module